MSAAAGRSAVPWRRNGIAKPPNEKSSPPTGGPTMYPNPVEISVIPRKNETFSESMSAMIA